MAGITTHILDTSAGKPAMDVSLQLLIQQGNEWQSIASAVTDSDGRVANWLLAGDAKLEISPGIYRIRFETGDYFSSKGLSSFYPFVEITFTVGEEAHYHVPLLLNPYGYSTYRGS